MFHGDTVFLHFPMATWRLLTERREIERTNDLGRFVQVAPALDDILTWHVIPRRFAPQSLYSGGRFKVIKKINKSKPLVKSLKIYLKNTLNQM